MKTLKKLVITILFATIPVFITAQEKAKTMETVKFKTSIECNNCVNKVMTNLPQEKGIKDVKCDLASKEVTVSYQKDKNNTADIKKAIEKLGFTAKVVTEEPVVKK
jgi:copper chaperone CopZ